MRTGCLFTKKSLILIVFVIISNVILAQRSDKAKTYCNLVVKTASYMSSISSEPMSSESFLDEKEGCYINGIQYNTDQTYKIFHADIIKFFKDSGTPEINTVLPWQFNEEKQGYVASFNTVYEENKLVVVMFYEPNEKVCVIRVWDWNLMKK